MSLPGLTVSTGLVGTAPVGVQIIATRFREDLCLLAGEAIEAGGVSVIAHRPGVVEARLCPAPARGQSSS